MDIRIDTLNKTIVNCKKCPRLVKFVKKISKEKRKKHIDEIYWGKPVTGFGNKDSKLMIIGLAPAAHGGTRTGRAFTGDKSGDFLFSCLYDVNLSNQPYSKKLNDGLKIKSTYMTNVLKCVPPEDKPSGEEIQNCSNYFNNEIKYLENLRVILALGKVAFDNFIKNYKKKYFIKEKMIFGHGKKYLLPDGKIIFSSYHPSPRNVNTGLLDKAKMKRVLISIKKLL